MVLYKLPQGKGSRRRASGPCPLSYSRAGHPAAPGRGQGLRQIAAEFDLSASTVRSHLHNVYGKLGALDRARRSSWRPSKAGCCQPEPIGPHSSGHKPLAFGDHSGEGRMPHLRFRLVVPFAGATACGVLLAVAGLGPGRRWRPHRPTTTRQCTGGGAGCPGHGRRHDGRGHGRTGRATPFLTNPSTHTVWFSWTPAVSMPTVLDVCDRVPVVHFTTEAVYTGNALNALTPVAQPPGSASSASTRPAGRTTRSSSTTTTRSGVTFRLRQPAPPANDAFANARPSVRPYRSRSAARTSTPPASPMNRP